MEHRRESFTKMSAQRKAATDDYWGHVCKSMNVNQQPVSSASGVKSPSSSVLRRLLFFLLLPSLTFDSTEMKWKLGEREEISIKYNSTLETLRSILTYAERYNSSYVFGFGILLQRSFKAILLLFFAQTKNEIEKRKRANDERCDKKVSKKQGSEW